MARQLRIDDTEALVKSRKMTGRSQTLPWWLGEEGVKTTESSDPLPYIYMSVVPTVQVSKVQHKGIEKLRKINK